MVEPLRPARSLILVSAFFTHINSRVIWKEMGVLRVVAVEAGFNRLLRAEVAVGLEVEEDEAEPGF